MVGPAMILQSSSTLIPSRTRRFGDEVGGSGMAGELNSRHVTLHGALFIFTRP
jgi:hypothetical protein